MGGFQQVDVARNQFDSKGLELAIQSMTQNLNNFYSTGTINEIGAIVVYGGTIPPTGFLLCDGSAISRSTFSALFAVLGTTYGTGDGSTTFNLPNLKGRVPVGLDTSQTEFNTMGKTGGHKLLQAHTHAESVGNGMAGGIALVAQANYSGGNFAVGNTTASTGGGNAENLQPYQVVNYIIRYALPGNFSGSTNIPRHDQVFNMYRNSSHISSNSYTKVAFDTVLYDPSGSINIANSRIIAKQAGYYHFQGVCGNTTASATNFYSAIYKNGVNAIQGQGQNGTTSPLVIASGDIYLNVGDYVELYFIGGAGYAMYFGSNSCYLSGHLITTV